MHLQGRACDFWFIDPAEADLFEMLAAKHGFGGIGKGKHLVHIDNGPPNRRWTYSDK